MYYILNPLWSQLTNHLFSNCKGLFNHPYKPFGLITCKSFQSSGSLKEISAVKLSGINTLYSPFLFKLLLNMLQRTNKLLICTHFPFCEFLPSSWVIDPFIPHPFTDPEGPVYVYNACILTPCSRCPHPLLPRPSLEEPPTACSSRPPAGSFHCPEAAELYWP